MKNFLKKLNIMSNQSEEEEASPFRGDKSHDSASSPDRVAHKPFSGLSNWLTSVANRQNPSPTSTSNVAIQDQTDSSDSVGLLSTRLEALKSELGSADSRNPLVDEEYQIQIALELSAREDPEAVQIEAVKQISLGSTASDNTPAEVVAYRYWNYNALSYDDKVLDGFYDLYGVVTDSSVGKMPSLMDLQETSLTETVMWEAILVNRAGDSNLLKLEERALELAIRSRLGSIGESKCGYLVRKLAVLVSDHMGGPVADPENMLRAWQSLSFSLKENLGSKVLPLGSLTVGLPRHRALLFKVLADSLGIPCKLVKGQQFSGSNDVAMNFVKLEDGREYIVDLMADPGILIPADAAGLYREYDESLLFSASPSSQAASSSSGVPSSYEDRSDFGTFDRSSRLSDVATAGHHEFIESASRNLTRPPIEDDAEAAAKTATSSDESKPSSATKHPFIHGRSPSWTEGVSSPIVRRMKVKDVSQYMLDATKENPQLAQKIHDVLLESGVVAPPNLFSDIYAVDSRISSGTHENSGQDSVPCFLPPLPHHNRQRYTASNQQEHVSEVAPAPPGFYAKNVPVAAAAAAAAAVVASSMVVAAAKSSADTSALDLPVAAAATATAAAVVATKAATAAVSKQYELGMRSDGDGDSNDPRGSGNREHDSEAERISDRSVGNESAFSDSAFDDVAEFDIPWEEIALGERIGLGSYGEVYRGEWHGTEVAVKKFLDQDMFGESLEEFRSEVRIMTKIRHPNVVLFMGAVTRPPHLSIITEFLPRGSLYRLIHRPNNQLDERRRLRMALDAARGMNYLHSCNPAIVHRDLKSPNLLVDKNWVVKVCDFGLSRRKHGTYLSSRSTAGTAEWMAPEVLRNEPSNEKCDVYSFGVILWELFTLQQPWGGMNPMQVVGAVGYQHRRLDIPNDIEPVIADIIKRCWQTDPKLRPSFAEIMGELKPLQKPITGAPPRPRASSSSRQDRGQRLEVADEAAD